MAAETVAFKYYSPVLYHASTVVGLLALAAGSYFLLENYAPPTAIGAVLLWFGLVIGALRIASNFVQDLTGEFVFGQGWVTLKTLWGKHEIPFA